MRCGAEACACGDACVCPTCGCCEACMVHGMARLSTEPAPPPGEIVTTAGRIRFSVDDVAARLRDHFLHGYPLSPLHSETLVVVAREQATNTGETVDGAYARLADIAYSFVERITGQAAERFERRLYDLANVALADAVQETKEAIHAELKVAGVDGIPWTAREAFFNARGAFFVENLQADTGSGRRGPDNEALSAYIEHSKRKQRLREEGSTNPSQQAIVEMLPSDYSEVEHKTLKRKIERGRALTNKLTSAGILSPPKE
jgi:hypothetical protein